jgi:RHS repeat-associated protein
MKRGATTLASVSYDRDPVGMVTAATEFGLPAPANPAARAYGYDAADNPTQVSGSSPFSYDKADELLSSPGTSYGYDALGERTTATTGAAVSTYGYDAGGRLTSFKPPSGATTTYAYNGDGLRTSKRQGTSTSPVVWGQTGDLPQILDDGGNSYLYGPDGLPIEQISSGGVASYLHHDQLGSTRLVTDKDGAVTGGSTYSSYGVVAATQGSARTALGYAGQYTDDESGLQYDRARYYSPATSQFLTRDPVERLTREPYAYALDNPLFYLDPTGLGVWGTVSSIGTHAAQGALGEADGLTGGLASHVLGIDTTCLGPSYDIGRAVGSAAVGTAVTVGTGGVLGPVGAGAAGGAASQIVGNNWDPSDAQVAGGAAVGAGLGAINHGLFPNSESTQQASEAADEASLKIEESLDSCECA